MSNPFVYWTTRFVGGLVALLGCGVGLPSATLVQAFGRGNYLAVDILLGTLGFFVAFTAVSPLVSILSADARLRREWGSKAHAEFARASTPQRVFLLLLAVAEADGSAGAAELELVRSFLQSRFLDPNQRADLDAWQRGPRAPSNLTELARLVARDLGQSERATLYSWGCLVAFADGPLQPAEFRALQQVASGLGLAPHQAMFLFEFAQQQARRQQHGGVGATPPPRDDRQDRGHGSDDANRTGNRAHGHSWRDRERARSAARPSVSLSPREAALATLGLPGDASRDDIRRRHRELVRQFHPDRHSTLGPVAQQEATERFVAIQRAYEVLTG